MTTGEQVERPRSENNVLTARHVLGVAFPHVQTDAHRGVELECCFLRLAFALNRLAESGQVRGYFAVLRQETRDHVRRLTGRYGVSDVIHVVFATLLVSDMTRLSDAADAVRRDGNPEVLTAVGREIATGALRREIELSEPGVVEKMLPAEMPFGLSWDFYGIVPQRQHEQLCIDPLNPRLL